MKRRSGRLGRPDAFKEDLKKQRLAPAVACCGASDTSLGDDPLLAAAGAPAVPSGCGASCSVSSVPAHQAGEAAAEASSCGSDQGSSCSIERDPFWHRLLQETWSATWMVVKFMTLAFLLTALIKLYVPEEWVAGLLGLRTHWLSPPRQSWACPFIPAT